LNDKWLCIQEEIANKKIISFIKITELKTYADVYKNQNACGKTKWVAGGVGIARGRELRGRSIRNRKTVLCLVN
jgi:hypothetical protein